MYNLYQGLTRNHQVKIAYFTLKLQLTISPVVAHVSTIQVNNSLPPPSAQNIPKLAQNCPAIKHLVRSPPSPSTKRPFSRGKLLTLTQRHI